jgi:hypothetical protein
MHYLGEVIQILTAGYSGDPEWPKLGQSLELKSYLTPHTFSENTLQETPEVYKGEALAVLNERAKYLDRKIRKYSGAVIASVVDAYDEFNVIVDANILEAISDLRELREFGLLRIGDKLFKWIEFIAKAFGVHRLLRLADFASNLVLLVKFGLEPSYNDLMSFVENWDEIMKRRTQVDSTVHGKVTHTFALSDMTVTMVTRTTMRLHMSNDSWLNMLMPLRQVGIEPTFENLWDLVPFSFVADWFFNIGDRLAYVDAGIHLLSMDVKYYVHSYTLYVDINDIPGFTGTGQLVLYRREVSQYFPFAHTETNSFHDWLGDVNVPPLVGGALAWKLLR